MNDPATEAFKFLVPYSLMALALGVLIFFARRFHFCVALIACPDAGCAANTVGRQETLTAEGIEFVRPVVVLLSSNGEKGDPCLINRIPPAGLACRDAAF